MESEQSTSGKDASTPDRRPSFLITIDTEGDNLWAKPREITARNAESLPRFQELCERYGLRPTYLANWEMAASDRFVEFGRSVLERDVAEIGMHLHAWNSPPLVPLTGDDFAYQPYLMEYPAQHISEKIKVMTDTLQTIFGVKMLSHRAGRWGLDETYASALADAGYVVDCSVTPHVDWTAHLGDPERDGGPDYGGFPESAYFMDPDDISQAGDSQLLQVPMTVIARFDTAWVNGLRKAVRGVPPARRLVKRCLPASWWLRPNGHNRDELLRTLAIASEQHRDYVEFMIHSSELMAGGSPAFPTSESIEALFDHIEALFDAARPRWQGATLQEYHARYVESARP